MTTALLAMAAAYGVHLVYSAVALGWDGIGPGPSLGPSRVGERLRTARPHGEGWVAMALPSRAAS